MLAPIVTADNRAQWDTYARQSEGLWYRESIELEGKADIYDANTLVTATVPFIHEYNGSLEPTEVKNSEVTLPIWQQYPLQISSVVPYMDTGFDLLSEPLFANLFRIVQATGNLAMGIDYITLDVRDRTSGTYFMQPIYNSPLQEDGREIVAVLIFRLDWKDYFDDLMVDTSTSLYVVLTSSCTDSSTGSTTTNAVTYQIDSDRAILLGDGDWHNAYFDDWEFSTELIDLQARTNATVPDGQCQPAISLKVYPTKEMKTTIQGFVKPWHRMLIALSVYMFPALVFLIYDRKVRRHQRKVMERVIQQDIIVSNVFPAAIRDRLYAKKEESQRKAKEENTGAFDDEGGPSTALMGSSSPLADLFPSTTIIVADIAGFTAWASAREPQQVFVLLETIFGALDQLAYRRGVFKVETVGDCMVAVAGLPDPMEDIVHAEVACKFASDCLTKMREITNKLEVSLGPDTGELELRIGIHR